LPQRLAAFWHFLAGAVAASAICMLANCNLVEPSPAQFSPETMESDLFL